ncbi:MAG: hypothetical protein JWQ01_4240 [Massilia sp.]|nr:hypothetical protein [Massilia sp.]
MALATICPHCNTRFRVASDQLKLRWGIVRCGACNEVFDGNAALVDAAARQAAEQAAPPAEAPPPPDQPDSVDAPAESASAAFDAEVATIDARQAEQDETPVYVLDFDTTLVPLPNQEPETEPDPPGSVPTFGHDPSSEPEPEPDVDEEIVALPPPDADDEPAEPHVYDADTESLAPLLMRASAAAEVSPPPDPQVAISKSARRNAAKRNKTMPKSAPLTVAADPFEAELESAPASEEPEFVRRVRLKEETGRTRRIAMAAACALLLVALAAQVMSTFRNVLAARFPETKPVLSATCAVFGCKVELPAQIDTLSVETGELQSLGANAFSYSTLLRNPGSLAQAWPHIELALTDANDKPLVRRVFTPGQYLPQGVAAAKGFGPRTEQPVKLFFELNQVKASGYHIAIFYP